MLTLLPVSEALTDKAIVSYLKAAMGEDALVEALVDHFYILGSRGKKHAIDSWSKLGLVTDNAPNTGIALQALLDKVDYEAESSGVDRLDASVVINNKDCIFITTTGSPDFSGSVYHTAIARI